jgi:hypothetical protein
MLLDLRCPQCHSEVRVDSSFVGTKRTCAQCQRRFVIERQAPAAREPKSNHRLFDSVCPACQTTERLAVMMAGTPRACPTCHHRYTVRLPEDVRQRVATARAEAEEAARAQATQLAGCASCFRVYWLAAAVGTTVRCQYCGAPEQAARALELGPSFESLRTRVELALLAGVRSLDLARSARDEDAAGVRHFIGVVFPELPALRSRALEARDRGATITLGKPVVCDRCAVAGPVEPYRLNWTRVLTEERTIPPATAVTILGGVVVTGKRQELQHLSEVAYLCQPCARRPAPPGPHYGLVEQRQLLPL